MRLVCALVAPISDCDETFNYWEPTHYLLYGRGLQTWEYSLACALRFVTWYLLPHAAVARAATFLLAADKRVAFYAVRCALGAFSALCEARFARAVGADGGRDVGATTLAFLLTAAGLFQKNIGRLPAVDVCDALLLLSTAAWVQPKPDYAGAIFGVAAAALLGWPFAAKERRTARARRARRHRPVRLRPWSAAAAAARLGRNSALVTKLAVRPPRDRAAQHPGNRSAATGSGSQLYGVEAWHCSLQNLALNLNALLPAALLGSRSSRSPTSTRRPATAAATSAAAARRWSSAARSSGSPSSRRSRTRRSGSFSLLPAPLRRRRRRRRPRPPPRDQAAAVPIAPRALTYAALNIDVEIGGSAARSSPSASSVCARSCTMARRSRLARPVGVLDARGGCGRAGTHTHEAAAAAGRRASAWGRSGTASRRTSSCPPTPSSPLSAAALAASSPRPTSRRRRRRARGARPLQRPEPRGAGALRAGEVVRLARRARAPTDAETPSRKTKEARRRPHAPFSTRRAPPAWARALYVPGLAAKHAANSSMGAGAAEVSVEEWGALSTNRNSIYCRRPQCAPAAMQKRKPQFCIQSGAPSLRSEGEAGRRVRIARPNCAAERGKIAPRIALQNRVAAESRAGAGAAAHAAADVLDGVAERAAAAVAFGDRPVHDDGRDAVDRLGGRGHARRVEHAHLEERLLAAPPAAPRSRRGTAPPRRRPRSGRSPPGTVGSSSAPPRAARGRGRAAEPLTRSISAQSKSRDSGRRLRRAGRRPPSSHARRRAPRRDVPRAPPLARLAGGEFCWPRPAGGRVAFGPALVARRPRLVFPEAIAKKDNGRWSARARKRRDSRCA